MEHLRAADLSIIGKVALPPTHEELLFAGLRAIDAHHASFPQAAAAASLEYRAAAVPSPDEQLRLELRAVDARLRGEFLLQLQPRAAR